MSDLNSLSKEALKARLAQIEAEEKAVHDKAASTVVEMGLESGFLEWYVENVPFKTTESTGRLGADFKTVPFTVDGKVYTVTIYVTDVAESEKGAVEAKVRKALADAQAKNAQTASALNAIS